MRSKPMKYDQFLKSKKSKSVACGFEPGPLNDRLFDWQADIVNWALRRGRAGLFPDTGLGKTLMQLVIGEQIVKETGGRFLILTPLAVAAQTEREADKFNIGVKVTVAASSDDVTDGITVANYEKLHKFDVGEFVGVALDEASILKTFGGKTRQSLIDVFRETPYRYMLTATPSPNDVMEIGSYAEFLGLMTRSEMLSTWFVHDGGETSKWRLKRHAEGQFFAWMASWCVMLNRPSDIGYSDEGYNLPPLTINEHIVESTILPGMLFQSDARTLNDQRAARRETIGSRVAIVADLVNRNLDSWIVWCNLNQESNAASKAISDSIEVYGSMKDDVKEKALTAFGCNSKRVIVTKPSIAGHGLNWQHCSNVAFVGLSHSFEQYYQAIRRSWRFGQTNPVNVHVIVSDRDGAIVENIKRKEAEHNRLVRGIVGEMSEHSRSEIKSPTRAVEEYHPTRKMRIPQWLMSSTRKSKSNGRCTDPIA